MIPYIEQPTLDIGSYRLEAFPVLVLLAIIAQYVITLNRAPKVGISRREASSMCGWAIGLGLIGAHVFDVVAYQPQRFAEDPLYLFKIWDSLSSFGGMLGGLGGLWWVMERRGLSMAKRIAFVDCLIYALPFTLAIGRLGCGLLHDHLGRASDHWLAVDFPGVNRFDLGLLESFYATGLSLLFLALGRRPRPAGFYVGLFFLLYGPVRFQLDSLRIMEMRYLGWTPGQYLSIVATLVGAAVLFAVLRRQRGADPEAEAA